MFMVINKPFCEHLLGENVGAQKERKMHKSAQTSDTSLLRPHPNMTSDVGRMQNNNEQTNAKK